MLPNPIIGQKVLYNLVSPDGKIGTEAMNSFKMLFNRELNAEYSNNAISKIIITSRNTNSGMLEGIDSRSINTLTMLVRLFNTITGRDTSFSFQYEIVALKPISAGDLLFNNFSGKNADVMVFKKAFNDFNKANLDCAKIAAQLKKLKADNQYEELLRKISRLEQNLLCNTDLAVLKKEVLHVYSTELCEKKLYDAKVLIANGSSQALNQATTILRSIPPSKECRDQAILVIHELSKAGGNQNERIQKKVNNLDLMWANIDINNWMLQLTED